MIKRVEGKSTLWWWILKIININSINEDDGTKCLKARLCTFAIIPCSHTCVLILLIQIQLNLGASISTQPIIGSRILLHIAPCPCSAILGIHTFNDMTNLEAQVGNESNERNFDKNFEIHTLKSKENSTFVPPSNNPHISFQKIKSSDLNKYLLHAMTWITRCNNQIIKIGVWCN